MWKPVTENDFPELMKTIKELNDGYIIEDLDPIKPFDIHVEITGKHGVNSIRIVDYNEELTWDGMLTEQTINKLNEALRKDTNDSNAYFDCVFCSEWCADWKGKDRYDKQSLELDIHIGILKAVKKYVEDNGLETHIWTDEQVKAFDDAYESVVNACMNILNSWKKGE